MVQWEYRITMHEFPEPKTESTERTIACDEHGHCFVHDAYLGGIDWLEDLLCEEGRKGWELVQSGYHRRQILCIWKKKKGFGKKA